MSAWTAAAIFATLVLAVAVLQTARGSIEARLVSLQFASTAAIVALLLIAQSFGNASAFDVALALALLSFPASIVYARFYARWL